MRIRRLLGPITVLAIIGFCVTGTFESIPGSFVSASTTQPVVGAWAKTYSWVGGSEAHSVDKTSDGGYIVAGSTNETSWPIPGSYSPGYDSDGWLLKLDSSGNIQWQRSYRTLGIDALYRIKQTSDGGFIAVGLTRLPNWGDVNAWVLRVDSQGNVLWDNSYGGTQTDQANDVVQTSDGGFIVVGFSYSFGALPAWAFRLDSAGGMVWQKMFNNTIGDSAADSIVATSDGGFVITGEYRPAIGPGTVSELWVFKINGNGDIEWQKAYDTGGKGVQGYSVIQTSDNGLVVVGYAVTNRTAWANIWVLRLDSQGSILWQKAYGGGGMTMFHEAYSIVQLSDGTFIVAGFSYNQFQLLHNSTPTAPVLRLDSNGNVMWGRLYGNGQFWQALVSADGGILLVGSSDREATVLKLDPDAMIGPDCPLEGQFNSTTIDTNAIGVTTSDTSTATTGKAYQVSARVIDSSATISVLCSNWLITLSANGEPSTVSAFATATLHVHVTSESNDLAGANVAFTTTDPGSLSTPSGLTDNHGNFTAQYTAPNLSSSALIRITAAVSKPGYASTQTIIKLSVNPIQKTPFLLPSMLLEIIMAVVAGSAVVLAVAFFASARRRRISIG